MDLLHQNLKVLKIRHPEYADEILKAKRNHNIKTVKNNKKLKDLEISGISCYNAQPVETAMKNLTINSVHCKLAFFIGFALGYELIAYGEKFSKNNGTHKIIVIEHDPYIMRLALENFDFTEILKYDKLHIILESNVNIIASEINNILLHDNSYYFLRCLSFFYNQHYFNINKELYFEIVNKINETAIGTTMFYGNDANDSLIGYWNMMDNIDIILNNPGINLLKDKFENIPAICIASGPSLDKNIDQLKDLQENAILIAADASLKPLLEKGIKPHLITSLEREPEITNLFSRIDDKYDYSDVYLAACPVIYNDAYKAYKGKKLIVYRQFDHFKWLGIDRGMLPIKVSPGNMNFTIAEYLGCNPIILVGQDLAIDGEKTNVSGTPHDKGYQMTYLNEQRFTVKGNYKETIETTRSLKQMLEAYNIDCLKTDRTVINATEGGAYIENTTVMTLVKALMIYLDKKHDIGGILSKNLDAFKSDEGEKERLKETTIKTMKEFYIIKNILFDMLSDVKKCISEDFPETEKTINALNESRIKISQYDLSWQLYFAHIAQSVFISFEMFANSFLQDMEKIDAEKKYIKLMEEQLKIITGLVNICLYDLGKFLERLNGGN